jgi:hypothetical protein
MTRLYLHGLSLHGPFFLSNFITNESYAYPVLRRYDVSDVQPESSEPWTTRSLSRHEFEMLKEYLALAGMPLRPRAFS